MNKKLIIFTIIILLTTACGQITANLPVQNPDEDNISIAEPVAAPTETTAPVFSPPSDFKAFADSTAEITIFIPENWVISQSIAGQYAILQSYPVDKYVGGGGLQPGDTKCDLFFRGGTSPDSLINEWKSNDMTVVELEEIFPLRDGVEGTKLVLQNMGVSSSVIVEINNQTVTFSCYGEFAQFDAIAFTLGGMIYD